MLELLLFVSGIALLLFAMQQMESDLTKLGSLRLQQYLQKDIEAFHDHSNTTAIPGSTS